MRWTSVIHDDSYDGDDDDDDVRQKTNMVMFSHKGFANDTRMVETTILKWALFYIFSLVHHTNP